jgi:hypothetical protein
MPHLAILFTALVARLIRVPYHHICLLTGSLQQRRHHNGQVDQKVFAQGGAESGPSLEHVGRQGVVGVKARGLYCLHVLHYVMCVGLEAVLAHRHAHKANALQGLRTQHPVALFLQNKKGFSENRGC